MLEGRHYQNAYVTRNIDQAVEQLTARTDARSVVEFEATTEVTTAVGRRPHVVKLAFIWVGDMQYEIIEPVAEAVPMFVNLLPEDDSLRFHHSCARVSDWADFRRRVDEQPYPVVMEGASGEDLKFLFLDTRELLGHYLEYTWMTDASWARVGGR